MECRQIIVDYPLLGLIKHCETFCVAECCGLDAFDFSPIHIASFLIRYTGKVESEEVDKIVSQLQELNEEAERLEKESGTSRIEMMNQFFDGPALFSLSTTIKNSLAEAVLLVENVRRPN